MSWIDMDPESERAFLEHCRKEREAKMDNRDWTIFRGKNGNPKWFQRPYEAWLILSGRHSLHRAWQLGLDIGTAMEYRRLITNKAYLAEAEKPLPPPPEAGTVNEGEK
jgi:hypothetical protein